MNKWKTPSYNDQDTLNVFLVMSIEKTIDKEIITRMIPIIKTHIKMKDMIKTIIEVYKEDKREFWDAIFSLILIIGTFYFMFWFFIPTFAYDM
jgi:predicted nucleic-acid-binding protein